MKFKTFLVIMALLITAASVSANPLVYGGDIFQNVANRITFDAADGSSIDPGDGVATHSTLLDPFTGMGQENKL